MESRHVEGVRPKIGESQPHGVAQGVKETIHATAGVATGQPSPKHRFPERANPVKAMSDCGGRRKEPVKQIPAWLEGVVRVSSLVRRLADDTGLRGGPRLVRYVQAGERPAPNSRSGGGPRPCMKHRRTPLSPALRRGVTLARSTDTSKAAQSAMARRTPQRARLGCGRKSNKPGRAWDVGGSPAPYYRIPPRRRQPGSRSDARTPGANWICETPPSPCSN